MPEAIEVRGLTRRFGSFVAVDHVSFTVSQGEMFGFLGPNGAGKTTTISMLTTLLRPSEGDARVAGFDIRDHPDEVRSSIGIVFQEPSLDERLTARENLEFHAVLYGLEPEGRTERIDQMLALVDLADRADDVVEKFSGGMRRRLEIARGILHSPRVLFLDEPTIGLDPQTRRSMWDHIRRLRDETGVTIFMTTHYMDEAEVCDRIAVMDHARIVALDTPEALKRSVGGDVVALTADDPEKLAGVLAEHGFAADLRDGVVRVEVADGAGFIPLVFSTYRGSITSVNLRHPTLDDVFLKLTGRTIRETELGEADIARNRLRSRIGMHGRRR